MGLESQNSLVIAISLKSKGAIVLQGVLLLADRFLAKNLESFLNVAKNLESFVNVEKNLESFLNEAKNLESFLNVAK